MSDDPIVGHSTFQDDDGTIRHEPLRQSEAKVILAEIEERKQRRAALMPDTAAAVDMLFEAWYRLKELGWNDACYCPKDVTIFEVIEAGSTGIHDCFYSGEWPDGYFNVMSGGDVWPSRPILYREKQKARDNAMTNNSTIKG